MFTFFLAKKNTFILSDFWKKKRDFLNFLSEDWAGLESLVESRIPNMAQQRGFFLVRKIFVKNFRFLREKVLGLFFNFFNYIYIFFLDWFAIILEFYDFLDFLRVFGLFSKLLRLLLNITEVTTKHQKSSKISTNRVKSSFLPEAQKTLSQRRKPSAGAKSKPR